MKKSIKDNPKKRRGRPATGKHPMVGVRMPEDLQEEIRTWAGRQDDDPPLATAIRRLVELGLTVKKRPKQPAPARAERAKEMAAKQLDHLVDQSASAEEQDSRKRRLLKGPEEFRDVRVDLNTKGK